ncbi:adenine phosphoribosyltransferase [Olsenella profusa DSM 13989]|uniref:Adenine phosphoribosyltransferase n=1 Tax=Olsenella profusa F0195 TaxID=1125712 RepID=U2T0F5_9ACTN|nr:adenine phosphoribosyltransferase [Olsenella profusa]ERL06544.1 adenine phosphoribosyltransferase [Olsenella profusa F0195]MDP9860321.1 adenine phosphoribosyltransferase [Olsenella profusa DSM 13989]
MAITTDLERYIVDVPDYPEPGVIFKDITPLMASPEGLHASVDKIVSHFGDIGITKVVGAEARGFLIGAPVAYRLGAGFVPARKPGKLPRAVYSQSYELEYGTDELQIHQDALDADDRVLIVDDLVATGGTCVATAKLIEQANAEVMGFSFILELAYLNPRDVISKEFDQEVFTLIQVG